MGNMAISTETGKLYPVYGRNSTGITTDTPSSPSTSSDAFSQVKKESSNKAQAQTNEYIEGTMSVIPNSDYTTQKIFKLNGVGKLFHGMYYTKRVTHTISSDSYTVECELLMVQKLVLNTKPKENVELDVKAQDNPKYIVITIKKGDTLWDLSRKYGSTVKHLSEINNIKNPDSMHVGDKLKVPAN